MGNKKKKNRKVKKRTLRTKDPRKRFYQDFRQFKNHLKRLVDKTEVRWEGKPFADGSNYQFMLDPELTNFILGLWSQQNKIQSDQLTLDQAQDIQEQLKPLEPDDETEAAFENFLTDGEAADNDGIDEEDQKG